MEREQVVKIVDEVAEGLMEGGPGSGRYPEGSGKNPDSKEKGDKLVKYDPNDKKQFITSDDYKGNSKSADNYSKLANKMNTKEAHKEAAHAHGRAMYSAKMNMVEPSTRAHFQEKMYYHSDMEKKHEKSMDKAKK